MTQDPYGRPPSEPPRGEPTSWQPAPHWEPGAEWQPARHGQPGPYAGDGPPPGGAYGPPTHPPGGPETRSYPPPPDGFSWRDRSDAPPPRPPGPPGPPIGRILLIIGAILALIAAGVAAYLLILRPAVQPRAAPTAVAPAPTVQPTAPAPSIAPAAGPVTLTAASECVSAPSRDAAGTVVEYGPEKMVDGRPDTAWRCDGDGAGRTIRVRFDRAARVTQVGIIPGYAKVDSTDGTDRYAQNRRIAQVRYTFDDGTTVDQTLDTAASERSVQTVAVPGVTSSGMTVSIVRSVPGSAVGPNKPSDRVAISELQVLAGGS